LAIIVGECVIGLGSRTKSSRSTTRTNQLISHARPALFVQPVHVNGLVFKSGVNIDGNGDKAEGKNTASNHASHQE
jgi:hypothetical protein